MACNLNHVKAKTKDCTEQFAGTAKRFFYIGEDQVSKVKWSEDGASIVASSESTTLYGIEVMFKKGTGQFTSKGNGPSAAFTNTLTGRVDADEDTYSANARTFQNIGGSGLILGEYPDGRFGVIGDPKLGGNITFETEYDSGTETTADHGHTFTWSCDTMLAPKVMLDKSITVTKAASFNGTTTETAPGG